MTKKLFKFIFLLIALAAIAHYLFLLFEINKKDSIVETKSTERYYCGMHPSVVSSFPGKCPICGMSLQKEEIAESLPISDCYPITRKPKNLWDYFHFLKMPGLSLFQKRCRHIWGRV